MHKQSEGKRQGNHDYDHDRDRDGDRGYNCESATVTKRNI